MSDTQVDPSFSVLSARIRRRIDRAFDLAIRKENGGNRAEPPTKKRKLNNGVLSDSIPLASGGFLVEDSPGPGGFLMDDQESVTSELSLEENLSTSQQEHTRIPLSLIPDALQILDLQPDDEDVLSVFRNAATGWETQTRGQREVSAQEELFVSRKDWRAVCAALLDTSGPSSDEEPSGKDEAAEEVVESEESEDEYTHSAEESLTPDEDEDSGDEYQDGGFVRTRSDRKGKAIGTSDTKKRRARRSVNTSDSDEDSVGKRGRITQRQKDECRKAFALFFPGLSSDQLDSQKIMIKDITRVADLLKEKISAEEVVEMLTEYSSSADRSMSLGDFERMMLDARMA